ncbi:MAG TPA: hypothetical protein VM597_24735, partial [Gemmataceae bacterium]|nr:hypothetical protein [Gemmataceae bacterium]
MTEQRLQRFLALAVLGLVGVLLASPVAAEPLPMPRVVGPAEPAGPLAVEQFLTPPKEILDAVLATRGQNVTLTNLSPDGNKFVVTKTDGLPPLSRLGCPCVHLAEMAFDPVAGRARDLWVRSADGFDLFDYADKKTIPVKVPAGARVSNPAWSPDGSKLAFFAHFEGATHIWVADAATGEARAVTRTPVLATLVTGFQWCKDGQRLQAVLRPDGWDAKPTVPAGPKVRVARDGPNPSRTYRYLLESPADMRQLEHLITGQLAVIDVADGKVTRVGGPAMISSVTPAGDAVQFRVTTVKKPFSYYVPFQRFGTTESVWDTGGKALVTLNDRNLRETEPTPPLVPPLVPPTAGPGRPKGATPAAADPTDPTDPNPGPMIPGPGPDPDPDARPRGGPPTDPDGRRDLTWRPDGAGLVFLQLEPERGPAKADAKSDPKAPTKAGAAAAAPKVPAAKDPPRKDRVMLWVAPFGKDDAKVVYESANRITSAQYSDDGKLLFVTQTIDNARQITAIDLADGQKTYTIHKGGRTTEGGPKKAAEVGEDDEQVRKGGFGGGAGGGPSLLTRGRAGATVVRISSAGEVYLSGTDRGRGGEGAFPKPYLEKVNIKTGAKVRVFEGKGDLLESIDTIDSDNATRVFTTKQKTDVVPDSYVTELATGASAKLTNNVDHSPWHRELKVQRFQVTRVDGFRFNVRVTTPPKAAGKLPALFWIYPRVRGPGGVQPIGRPGRG